MKEVFSTYHGPHWRELFRKSEFCLLPRGFGRTLFSLYDAVQMGTCIPVYVYDDLEWLPYQNTAADLHGFGVSIQSSNLWKLPSVLDALSPSMRVEMLTKMRSLRDSHFTYMGVMDQVARFLSPEGSTDLRASNKRPSTDH